MPEWEQFFPWTAPGSSAHSCMPIATLQPAISGALLSVGLCPHHSILGSGCCVLGWFPCGLACGRERSIFIKHAKHNHDSELSTRPHNQASKPPERFVPHSSFHCWLLPTEPLAPAGSSTCLLYWFPSSQRSNSDKLPVVTRFRQEVLILWGS